MKTLNLVDLEKSDIKYKISKFPDGQQNIVLIGINEFKNGYPNLSLIKDSVQIKSRLNTFKDLELIICAVACIREIDVQNDTITEIHLYTPYIMGARSDRKFEEGGNNYLKDVICPMINHLELDSVTVMDGHSDCLEMGIKKYKKLDNLSLVEFTLFNLYSSSKYQPNSNFLLLSPDAGASKKVEKIAKRIRYEGDIIVCSKVRETNGEIIKTHVPLNIPYGDYLEKDILILDDICDGGRTFINIAESIKSNKQFIGKIYLIVTHGIFSAGFEELNKHFDGIYCTNSYSTIFPGAKKDFVKQLNVF